MLSGLAGEKSENGLSPFLLHAPHLLDNVPNAPDSIELIPLHMGKA
jgi:hypothetical protein